MKRIKNCIKAYVFVGILFFLFGGLTVFVQLLVPHLRDIFELNYTHASLLLLFFFLPYLLFSIPAGFILARLGYQRGIIIGLILIALGALLFHPASEERQFSLFLLASFVLGSGITFLQVAANPYVALLGEPSSAPVRLTFSQAFNALGTMVAPLAGGFFLLNDEVKTSSELAKLSTIDRNMYFQQEALAIQIPFLYIALAVTFLAFLFALIRLRTGNCIGYEEPSTSYNYVALLKKPSLLLAAIGIFLYVGAEVVIGSFAVNYFLEMNVVKELAAYPQLLSLKHFLGKTVVPSSPQTILKTNILTNNRD
nr:MFS transporter [uncultured Capnocytophaga sp.]